MIAVAQPHRFTRLRDLMGEFQCAFNDADMVFVAPVYPAGEEPIAGVDSAALVKGLSERGHRVAQAVDGPDELAAQLARPAAAGDMVVCLGAGDITKWAAGLADDIRASERAAVASERAVGTDHALDSERGEGWKLTRTRRSTSWSGSRAAARPTGCSSPPTSTISPRSSRELDPTGRSWRSGSART